MKTISLMLLVIFLAFSCAESNSGTEHIEGTISIEDALTNILKAFNIEEQCNPDAIETPDHYEKCEGYMIEVDSEPNEFSKNMKVITISKSSNYEAFTINNQDEYDKIIEDVKNKTSKFLEDKFKAYNYSLNELNINSGRENWSMENKKVSSISGSYTRLLGGIKVFGAELELSLDKDYNYNFMRARVVNLKNKKNDQNLIDSLKDKNQKIIDLVKENKVNTKVESSYGYFVLENDAELIFIIKYESYSGHDHGLLLIKADDFDGTYDSIINNPFIGE